jgi:hypothetical protein
VASLLLVHLLAAARQRDQVPQPGPRGPLRGLQHPPRGAAQPGHGGRAAHLQAREYRLSLVLPVDSGSRPPAPHRPLTLSLSLSLSTVPRDRLRDPRGDTAGAARAAHDDEDVPGLPGRVPTGRDEAESRRAAAHEARGRQRAPGEAREEQEVQAHREGGEQGKSRVPDRPRSVFFLAPTRPDGPSRDNRRREGKERKKRH